MIKKKILYLDMDGVLADFDEKMNRLLGPNPPNHRKDIEEGRPGYYRDLNPLAGAIDAFNTLNAVFDLYILSTASWTNPSSWTDKRLWVEEHLGDIAKKRLILSHNKGLLRGDILVDDRIRNGVEFFKGLHIHFGQDGYKDWAETLPKLLKMA